MKTLDGEEMRIIALFEAVTRAKVLDLIRRDDELYILIAPFPGGIKTLKPRISEFSRATSKKVEVFIHSDDEERFVRSLLHRFQIRSLEIVEVDGRRIARVEVPLKDKGRVIGRGGRNLKVLNEILRRNSNIHEIKVL